MSDSKPANADIDQLFVQHLRRSTRPDGKQGQLAEKELRRNRQEQQGVEESTLPETKQRARNNLSQQPESQFERQSSPKRQLADPTDVGVPETPEEPQSKKLKSPDFASSQSPSAKPIRSRARAIIPPQYVAGDFEAVPREPSRKLWDDSRPGIRPPAQNHRQGAGGTRMPHVSSQSHRRPPAAKGGGGGQGGGGGAPSLEEEDIPEGDDVTKMITQPETRPISQEQLVAEVKGIYAGLVMVESKCIEVDNAQNSQNESSPPLNKEQWQALIALHRTLLHEHHDFFLASQHPAASEALRRLANKYAMPARMWRHGIHSFLELLRHRLPHALEYMQTFIYLAYSMMALLYETVPAFEETWIECLGDLSRYRMAIEDDDLRDREVWTSVSRHWYSKASDKTPATGRLYHHLAILARPDAVTQLFYYVKSLCVSTPFNSARESILTLFDPVVNGLVPNMPPIERSFVKVHSVFFTKKNQDQLEDARNHVLSELDLAISMAPSWAKAGYQFAVTNTCACFEYGAHNNELLVAMNPAPAAAASASASVSAPIGGQNDGTADVLMGGTVNPQKSPQQDAGIVKAAPESVPNFSDNLDFTQSVDDVVFTRLGDPNILSYVNVRLSFMRSMADVKAAMVVLEDSFSWALLALTVNSFLADFENSTRFQQTALPGSDTPKVPKRPLPEDWAMRGFQWAEGIFPAGYFDVPGMDDDERTLETPSMAEQRKERILWLAWNLAQREEWLLFDSEAKQFRPTAKYAKEIQPRTPMTWTREVGASDKDSEQLPDADDDLAIHPSEAPEAVAQSSPISRPTIIQRRVDSSTVADSSSVAAGNGTD